MSQHMQALARATEVREAAARQRRELTGASPDAILFALRNPTVEFGSYRLSRLFTVRNSGPASIIPGLGWKRFQRVLHRLAGDPHLGRRSWHSELRLNELSDRERERLVQELRVEASRGKSAKWLAGEKS